MTYQEALQFIREQQSRQTKKRDIKQKLIESGFSENSASNLLDHAYQKYEEEGRLKNLEKNKNHSGFFPLYLFWAGLFVLFFNFYIALAIIFISAFLFVGGDYKEKGFAISNLNQWKLLWEVIIIFGGLIFLAFIALLFLPSI